MNSKNTLELLFKEIRNQKLMERLILTIFYFNIIGNYIGFSGPNGLVGSTFLLVCVLLIWPSSGKTKFSKVSSLIITILVIIPALALIYLFVRTDNITDLILAVGLYTGVMLRQGRLK